MPHRSEPVFVTGLAQSAAPQHHLNPSASTTTRSMMSTTVSKAAKNVYAESSISSLRDAINALEAGDFSRAARHLKNGYCYVSNALGEGDRPLNAVNAKSGGEFSGYSINATNDTASAAPAVATRGEFAGYDLNNPEGK